MNIKEFKKEAKMNRPILKFSDKSYGELPWKDWYRLANATSRIEYKCYFHNDGTCIQMRRIKKEGNTPNKMCCCHNCASSVGYLNFVQNDPKVISKIAGHFRPKIGFWRKDKGCILPRKYRSAVCLGYRCDSSAISGIYGNGNILIAFMNAIRLKALKGQQLYNLGKALLSLSI